MSRLGLSARGTGLAMDLLAGISPIHPLLSTARTVACIVALAFVATSCGDDPKVQIPEPRVFDPLSPSPNPDELSECTGVSDGTACGEAGADFHCIFGTCRKNVCGDFVHAGFEGCDDGNDVDGDGCDRLCRLESCGNGRVDGGEECDDGNQVDDDGCSNLCTVYVCGNGRIDPGEECDDGNQVDDDRCSNACTRNLCRNGRRDPGEECDDGNRTHDDFCSNACTRNICGNGRRDPGEECDDGNEVDGDACSNACRFNVCGNQRVDVGEICDGDVREVTEGGIVVRQTCRADCSGYDADECLACMERECTDYAGFDLFGGCRVEVDSDVTNPMADYIAKCTALDDCVRTSGCFDPERGTVPCYCGNLSVPECQNAAAVPTGACASEVMNSRPAECLDVVGAALNSCVLGKLDDLTVPWGWARFLAQCRSELCATECAR